MKQNETQLTWRHFMPSRNPKNDAQREWQAHEEMREKFANCADENGNDED